MKKAFSIVAVCFVAFALVFLCIDCSMGTIKHFECEVTDHVYIPAWCEVHVSTDADGNSSTWTEWHDEEFHLMCNELQGAERFEVNVLNDTYRAMTNGQYATVLVRKGKWTGAYYLPRIER